ncbi:MAG: methyltransferase [Bacteroidetes bacterium]|nr:methyltransferase [Bacteroidota bacterium]
MANTFFQFKQFIVHQEHTSMKVCTDACLFGGWVVQSEKDRTAVKNILDIGTGTGLLSLMMAQSNPTATITAVEIETLAAQEAQRNFEISPWKVQLKLVHHSIQKFTTDSNEVFDTIITNPPFFEDDLKSPDQNKNKAAHSTELPWPILIENVKHLLAEEGYFYVLTPTLRAYTMQKLCEKNGLQLIEEVLVHNASKNLPIRAMQKFIKTKVDTNNTSTFVAKRFKITIKDADNNYTESFHELLREYYLHLI